jgi:ADP-ribose pyrophosphatase
MGRLPVPLSRELLLQSEKFSVERRRWEHPDGSHSVHDVLVHPGAVVILPILQDGSWVMIRNVRPAVGTELVELPAGTLEPAESPMEGARRELEEETGYRASELERVHAFYSCPGVSNERMHGFVARGLTRTRQSLAPGEQIRVEAMSAEQVIRMLSAGLIEDGKTIALLGLYLLRQGR